MHESCCATEPLSRSWTGVADSGDFGPIGDGHWTLRAPSRNQVGRVALLDDLGKSAIPQLARKLGVISRTIRLGDLVLRVVRAGRPIDTGPTRRQPDELVGSLVRGGREPGADRHAVLHEREK